MQWSKWKDEGVGTAGVDSVFKKYGGDEIDVSG